MSEGTVLLYKKITKFFKKLVIIYIEKMKVLTFYENLNISNKVNNFKNILFTQKENCGNVVRERSFLYNSNIRNSEKEG